MKVIDASVVLEVIRNSSVGRQAAIHLDDDLYAPDLLVSEVLNRLRHDVRAGALTELSHSYGRTICS